MSKRGLNQHSGAYLTPDNANGILARKLYDQGATDNVIADAISFSTSSVRRWRHALGLPPRTANNAAKGTKNTGLIVRSQIIPNVNNRRCPVEMEAKISFVPHYLTETILTGPRSVTGTVVEINTERRWYRVAYDMEDRGKRTTMTETFKWDGPM